LINADVAARYPSSCEIEALTEHVPAETNATTPDDDPTVHIEEVLVEYDLVPEPADAAEVKVGGVAAIK
jgi:hypothetical protein